MILYLVLAKENRFAVFLILSHWTTAWTLRVNSILI